MGDITGQNSIFAGLVDPLHVEFLHDLTQSVIHEIPADKSPADYWVAYGSVVLNALSAKSDVDIMFVSSTQPDVALRRDAEYRGRPVSVYVVGQESIEQDGRDFYYGGYFAGKLLSPHVVVHDKLPTTISAAGDARRVVGNFLGNFIDRSAIDSSDRLGVASESLKTYLKICPWYKAYMLKFFASKIDPDILADCLVEHYVTSLCESGQIVQSGETYHLAPGVRVEEPERIQQNIIKAIARFWSFGAIEHGNDHRFGDYYFDKADAAAKYLDPDAQVWPEICRRLGLPA